jgi:hypothetical protein
VILLGELGGVSADGEYHRPLKMQRLFPAFQADDEGSIPFTRSNHFIVQPGHKGASKSRMSRTQMLPRRRTLRFIECAFL